MVIIATTQDGSVIWFHLLARIDLCVEKRTTHTLKWTNFLRNRFVNIAKKLLYFCHLQLKEVINIECVTFTQGIDCACVRLCSFFFVAVVALCEPH